MTIWIPSMLALVLVAVEVRRLLLGHWRRERWRAVLARAVEIHVGVPQVFAYSVGMVSDVFRSWEVRSRGPYIVKINYATGKLWVLDV